MPCGCFVLTGGLNFSSGRFGAITWLLGYRACFAPVLLKTSSSSEAGVQCAQSSVAIDHRNRAVWQGQENSSAASAVLVVLGGYF